MRVAAVRARPAAPARGGGWPAWTGWSGLSLLLAVAGAGHLVRPRTFEAIVPRALGAPRPWVLGSGLAELACAAALAAPRTRRAGGLASAGLFAGVFPANVQMAVSARHGPGWYRALALGRLPLQVPLVLAALRVADGRDAGRGSR